MRNAVGKGKTLARKALAGLQDVLKKSPIAKALKPNPKGARELALVKGPPTAQRGKGAQVKRPPTAQRGKGAQGTQTVQNTHQVARNWVGAVRNVVGKGKTLARKALAGLQNVLKKSPIAKALKPNPKGARELALVKGPPTTQRGKGAQSTQRVQNTRQAARAQSTPPNGRGESAAPVKQRAQPQTKTQGVQPNGLQPWFQARIDDGRRAVGQLKRVLTPAVEQLDRQRKQIIADGTTRWHKLQEQGAKTLRSLEVKREELTQSTKVWGERQLERAKQVGKAVQNWAKKRADETGQVLKPVAKALLPAVSTVYRAGKVVGDVSLSVNPIKKGIDALRQTPLRAAIDNVGQKLSQTRAAVLRPLAPTLKQIDRTLTNDPVAKAPSPKVTVPATTRLIADVQTARVKRLQSESKLRIEQERDALAKQVAEGKLTPAQAKALQDKAAKRIEIETGAQIETLGYKMRFERERLQQLGPSEANARTAELMRQQYKAELDAERTQADFQTKASKLQGDAQARMQRELDTIKRQIRDGRLSVSEANARLKTAGDRTDKLLKAQFKTLTEATNDRLQRIAGQQQLIQMEQSLVSERQRYITDVAKGEKNVLQRSMDQVRERWTYVMTGRSEVYDDAVKNYDTSIDRFRFTRQQLEVGQIKVKDLGGHVEKTYNTFAKENERVRGVQAKQLEYGMAAANVTRDVGAVVTATGVTLATGGNVLAGAAAGYGVKEAGDLLIEGVGSTGGKAQQEMTRGRSWVFHLATQVPQGKLGGWKATGDALLREGGDFAWSFVDAFGAKYVSAATQSLGQRYAPQIFTGGGNSTRMQLQFLASGGYKQALPALLVQRTVSTALASAVAGTQWQLRRGAGEVYTTTLQVAGQGKLWSPEGVKTIRDKAIEQTVAAPFAFVSSGAGALLPSSGRSAIVLQALSDTSSGVAEQQVTTLLTQGRGMTGVELFSSVYGGALGSVNNLLLHPDNLRPTVEGRPAAAHPDAPSLPRLDQVNLPQRGRVIAEAMQEAIRRHEANGDLNGLNETLAWANTEAKQSRRQWQAEDRQAYVRLGAQINRLVNSAGAKVPRPTVVEQNASSPTVDRTVDPKGGKLLETASDVSARKDFDALGSLLLRPKQESTDASTTSYNNIVPLRVRQRDSQNEKVINTEPQLHLDGDVTRDAIAQDAGRTPTSPAPLKIGGANEGALPGQSAVDGLVGSPRGSTTGAQESAESVQRRRAQARREEADRLYETLTASQKRQVDELQLRTLARAQTGADAQTGAEANDLLGAVNAVLAVTGSPQQRAALDDDDPARTFEARRKAEHQRRLDQQPSLGGLTADERNAQVEKLASTATANDQYGNVQQMSSISARTADGEAVPTAEQERASLNAWAGPQGAGRSEEARQSLLEQGEVVNAQGKNDADLTALSDRVMPTILQLNDQGWFVSYGRVDTASGILANLDDRELTVNTDGVNPALAMPTLEVLLQLELEGRPSPLQQLQESYPSINWKKMSWLDRQAVITWVEDKKKFGENPLDFFGREGQFWEVMVSQETLNTDPMGLGVTNAARALGTEPLQLRYWMHTEDRERLFRAEPDWLPPKAEMVEMARRLERQLQHLEPEVLSRLKNLVWRGWEVTIAGENGDVSIDHRSRQVLIKKIPGKITTAKVVEMLNTIEARALTAAPPRVGQLSAKEESPPVDVAGVEAPTRLSAKQQHKLLDRNLKHLGKNVSGEIARLKSLVDDGWTIRFSPDSWPIDLDKREITIPPRITAKGLTDLVASVAHLTLFASPLATLTERFPGLNWEALETGERLNVLAWAQDSIEFGSTPEAFGKRVGDRWRRTESDPHSITISPAETEQIATLRSASAKLTSSSLEVSAIQSTSQIQRLRELMHEVDRERAESSSLSEQPLHQRLGATWDTLPRRLRNRLESLEARGWKVEVQLTGVSTRLLNFDEYDRRLLIYPDAPGFGADDLWYVLTLAARPPAQQLLETQFPSINWDRLSIDEQTVLMTLMNYRRLDVADATGAIEARQGIDLATEVLAEEKVRLLRHLVKALGFDSADALQRRMHAVDRGSDSEAVRALMQRYGIDDVSQRLRSFQIGEGILGFVEGLRLDMSLDTLIQSGWMMEVDRRASATLVDVGRRTIVISMESGTVVVADLRNAFAKAIEAQSLSSLQAAHPNLAWENLPPRLLPSIDAWRQADYNDKFADRAKVYDKLAHKSVVEAAKKLGFRNPELLREAMLQEPESAGRPAAETPIVEVAGAVPEVPPTAAGAMPTGDERSSLAKMPEIIALASEEPSMVEPPVLVPAKVPAEELTPAQRDEALLQRWHALEGASTGDAGKSLGFKSNRKLQDELKRIALERHPEWAEQAPSGGPIKALALELGIELPERPTVPASESVVQKTAPLEETANVAGPPVPVSVPPPVEERAPALPRGKVEVGLSPLDEATSVEPLKLLSTVEPAEADKLDVDAAAKADAAALERAGAMSKLRAMLEESGGTSKKIQEAFEDAIALASLPLPESLNPSEALALALYRRAYDLKARQSDARQFNLTVKQSLVTFLQRTGNLDSAGGSRELPAETVRGLYSAGMKKVDKLLDPDNLRPNGKFHRVIEHLDRELPRLREAANRLDPARELVQDALRPFVEDGVLSEEAAAAFFGDAGLSVVPTISPASRGQPWTLTETDVRHFPVARTTATQKAAEKSRNAEELLHAWSDGLSPDASSDQPNATVRFQKSVGLRALRDSHAVAVQRLIAQAWEQGESPSAQQLHDALFGDRLNGLNPLVNSTVQQFVDETRRAIAYALSLKHSEGWQDLPLTPAQATAATRLIDRTLESLLDGEKGQYLIALPNSVDNRRAAFATLKDTDVADSIGNGVVLWTSHRKAAEIDVPAEARRLLGEEYEIVTSFEALAERSTASDRRRPLLAIFSDDDRVKLDAALQVLPSDRPLVYVADEAQRLSSAGTKRRDALDELPRRAGMTIALSSEPVGRSPQELVDLATFINVPEIASLDTRDVRVLYAALAPHFMAAGSMRGDVETLYPALALSEEAASLQADLQDRARASGADNYHLSAQLGIEEKLPLIAQRVEARLAEGGKVVIASRYVNDGVKRIDGYLKQQSLAGGPSGATARIGQMDGTTPVQERAALLARFALSANEPNALDVLITTYDVAKGSTAVGLESLPVGGYEAIAADIPSTPQDLNALVGLVSREEMSESVPVRLTVPVMQFTPAQQRESGLTRTTDQDNLNRLTKRREEAAGALGKRQDVETYQPTETQLARYRLGQSYWRTLEGNVDFFKDIGQVVRYMDDNELPGPWQQATRYLENQVRAQAEAMREGGKSPRLLDLGSGFNYLVSKLKRGGEIDEGAGIDLIPAATMQALVERGKLAVGSDTLHIAGQIQNAPELLQEHWGANNKANIATASFSLLGRDPQLIASYFRASNEAMDLGGRFLIVHPLASFDQRNDVAVKEGLKQMGFLVLEDRELITVGGSIRYLALEKFKQPDADVDPELFRFKVSANARSQTGGGSPASKSPSSGSTTGSQESAESVQRRRAQARREEADRLYETLTASQKRELDALQLRTLARGEPADLLTAVRAVQAVSGRQLEPLDEVRRHLELPELQQAIATSQDYLASAEANAAQIELRNGPRVTAIEISDDQIIHFSRTSDFLDRHFGSVAAYQTHYPATTEVLRSLGLDVTAIASSALQHEQTTVQRLVVDGFVPSRSPSEARFAIQRDERNTSEPYSVYATAALAVASHLLDRGVPNEMIAQVLAENRHQWELFNGKRGAAYGLNPGRYAFLHFMNHRHSRQDSGLSTNLTPFVDLFLSGEEVRRAYVHAAQAAVDLLRREPEHAVVLRSPRGQLGNVESLLAFANLSEFSGIDGLVEMSDAGKLPWLNRLMPELQATKIGQPRSASILGGNIIYVPLTLSSGSEGGGLTIAELAKPQGYVIEVLLNQGRGGPLADSEYDGRFTHSPELEQRQRDSLDSDKALDVLVREYQGRPVDREGLRRFAELWFDKSVTSGGWTGGGAGINHVHFAAVFRKLTGVDMPTVVGPVDLIAVTSSSKGAEAFVKLVESGQLFEGGAQFIRDLGIQPGPGVALSQGQSQLMQLSAQAPSGPASSTLRRNVGDPPSPISEQPPPIRDSAGDDRPQPSFVTESGESGPGKPAMDPSRALGESAHWVDDLAELGRVEPALQSMLQGAVALLQQGQSLEIQIAGQSRRTFTGQADIAELVPHVLNAISQGTDDVYRVALISAAGNTVVIARDTAVLRDVLRGTGPGLDARAVSDLLYAAFGMGKGAEVEASLVAMDSDQRTRVLLRALDQSSGLSLQKPWLTVLGVLDTADDPGSTVDRIDTPQQVLRASALIEHVGALSADTQHRTTYRLRVDERVLRGFLDLLPLEQRRVLGALRRIAKEEADPTEVAAPVVNGLASLSLPKARSDWAVSGGPERLAQVGMRHEIMTRAVLAWLERSPAALGQHYVSLDDAAVAAADFMGEFNRQQLGMIGEGESSVAQELPRFEANILIYRDPASSTYLLSPPVVGNTATVSPTPIAPGGRLVTKSTEDGTLVDLTAGLEVAGGVHSHPASPRRNSVGFSIADYRAAQWAGGVNYVVETVLKPEPSTVDGNDRLSLLLKLDANAGGLVSVIEQAAELPGFAAELPADVRLLNEWGQGPVPGLGSDSVSRARDERPDIGQRED